MIRELKLTVLFFMMIFLAGLPISGDAQSRKSKRRVRRPKVGLVLSGGGAKGLAHIGILKTIEELNIPVDYIAGTSMGATVAALYAIGYSADELEEIALKLDWSSYLNNNVPRKNLSLLNKYIEDSYPFSLEFKRGFTPPQGLIDGYKLNLLLTKLTGKVHGVNDFSKFQIPFLCMATDIESGKGVILDKGFLPDCLRASMAIPSVFKPVEIDGKLLVDGGIVKNLPVLELKKAGADIIIAVDVGAPLYTKKELNSFSRIMEQSLSFLGDISTKKNRKLADILIIPDIKGYDATSFDAAEDLLRIGQRAAARNYGKLEALSRRFKKYNIKSERDYKNLKRNEYYLIKDIRVNGIPDEFKPKFKEFLGLVSGERIKIRDIETSINNVYGTKMVDDLNYQLMPYDNGYRLIINVKFNQTNFLNFGIHYDTDLKSALLMNLVFFNPLIDNSVFMVDTRLGEYPKVHGSWRYNLNYYPDIFVGFSGHASLYDIYTYDTKRDISRYKYFKSSGSVGMGVILGNYFLFTLGIQKEFFRYDTEVSDQSEDYNLDYINAVATLRVDTLDNKYYPNYGVSIYGEVKHIRDDFSKYKNPFSRSFNRGILSTLFVIPLGSRVSFQFGGHSSIVSTDNVPPSYLFYMGGYEQHENWGFPLLGYDFLELNGNHGLTNFITLQAELFKDYYLLLKWNRGKAVDSLSELKHTGGFKSGYGITLGVETFLGPVEGSVLKRTGEQKYYYHFNIGTTF